MADTSIEWTDKVWNATRGCSRISAGCGGAKGEGGCYAERQAARFSGPGMPYEGLVRIGTQGPRWTGKVVLVPEMLDAPLHWRKSRRVFVNSMSDLFHEALTNEQIAAVFGVMAACPQHTFQCLTKRPKRMREFLTHPDCRHWIAQAMDAALVEHEHSPVETWRTIPGFDGYDASTHGRVRSPAGMLATYINERLDRETVTLWNKGNPETRFVHQLVLSAHDPCPIDGLEVCHRNGNKRDNRRANLRWGTRSENQNEKVRHGSNGGPQKLTRAQVQEIRAARAGGQQTQQTIADRYGVSRSLVSMIEHGVVWTEPAIPWPLPNVHLGVSVENQATADERIPELLACPAAVWWISLEPQLADVDLTAIRHRATHPLTPGREYERVLNALTGESWVGETRYGGREEPGLSWVVQGGESGPGARPFDLAWARRTRDQCREAHVPYFLKQLGANAMEVTAAGTAWDPCLIDRKGGDMREWPTDLRVRMWPGEAW